MTLSEQLSEAAGKPRTGDKRVFWGREFKWTGSSWEPTDGKAREGVPADAKLYHADPTKPLPGPKWDKKEDGTYVGTGFKQGKVELKRGKGKSWIMVVGGKEHDLGRRASFDTAERKLASL